MCDWLEAIDKGSRLTLKQIVECLHSNGLRLQQSDKTGNFAVLEESQYQEKVGAAISKNF